MLLLIPTVLKMKHACIMCLDVLSSLLNLMRGAKSETGAAEESCEAELGLTVVVIHLLGKVGIAAVHWKRPDLELLSNSDPEGVKNSACDPNFDCWKKFTRIAINPYILKKNKT